MNENIEFSVTETISDMIDSETIKRLRRESNDSKDLDDRIHDFIIEDNCYHGFYFDVEMEFTDYTILDETTENIYYNMDFCGTIEADELLDKLRRLSPLAIYWEKDSLRIEDDSFIVIHGTSEEIELLAAFLDGNYPSLEEYYTLPNLDLEIGARVQQQGFGEFTNQIVIRSLDDPYAKEGTIDCVHTAVTTLTLDEYDEDMMFNIESAEGMEEIEISFEEHFFALNSFVAGIVEFGLTKIIRESYNYSEMNFGFNSAMHSQFIHAICKVNLKIGEEIIKSFFLDILQSMKFEIAKEWLSIRHSMLAHRFNFFDFRVINQFEVKIYLSDSEINEDFDEYVKKEYAYDKELVESLLTKGRKIRYEYIRKFLGIKPKEGEI